MIRLSRALKSLYPDAEWVIENEDFNKIKWVKNAPTPLPTYEDLEAEALKLEQKEEQEKYRSLRRNEYPPLSDLADALYWQAQGDKSKMTAYIAAVDAVKQKYPKE